MDPTKALSTIEEIIFNSLKPVIDFLSRVTSRPYLVLLTIAKAISDRTSIRDAVLAMQKIDSLRDILFKKRSWQHVISRAFKKVTVKEVEAVINRSLEAQVEMAREYGALGEVLIIDQKEKAAWHKKHNECLVSINPKKKPNHKGHRFYASAVAGHVPIFIHFVVDDGNISAGEAFQRLLTHAERTVNSNYGLIDAGFYGEVTYRAAQEAKSMVIGIAPRNRKISRIILEHHRALSRHYEYGLYPYRIKGTKVHLVIVPKSRDKRVNSNDHDVRRIVHNYIPFVVTKVPKHFPERIRSRGHSDPINEFRSWASDLAKRYNQRALIEVLYRLMSLIEARIGVHHASLRFFIFGLGLVLVNISQLVKFVVEDLMLMKSDLTVRVIARAVQAWLKEMTMKFEGEILISYGIPVSGRPPPPRNA